MQLLTTCKVLIKYSVLIFGSHPEELRDLSWGGSGVDQLSSGSTMLGHLQVRQSSLPSPHRVLLFFLTPSQVPCGLNSCPIDSIAKPEELLTLVGYWVDRAGDLIDRWHNYSKIVQKDTRQVLTRSQSLLLYHTLLSLRVGKNRPCSGTASTTARTMPTEEACAGLSRPMIALASPANHV